MVRAEGATGFKAGAAARTRPLVARIPIWAWLGGLVVVSAAIRFMLALDSPAPWIFQDELLYSELAKSLGNTGHFAIRGSPGLGGFGPVYPALIAPAYALFRNLPHAYEAAKAINAVLMSLTAVPTFLISKRLVSPALALLAAALSLAIPSMIYTGTIMTENAFYPVFVFFLYALVLALERPTVLRQLLASALVGVAYETRNQGVVLAPVLVTALLLAVLLDTWADRERPRSRVLVRRLAAYWVAWLALAAGALIFFVVQVVVRGRSLSDAVLGGYSVLSSSQYPLRDLLRWLVYHLGELDLAIGVVPFAAFILLLLLGLRPREPSRELRIFAAIGLSATAWLTIEVAAFATTPFGQQIQERNLFYLAPVFLVAMVAWLGRGLPRPPVSAGIAAVVAGVLATSVPYASLLSNKVYSNAVGMLPLIRLEERGFHAEELTLVVALAAAVGAILFLSVPRRAALLVPVLVFAYFVFAGISIERKTTAASKQSRLGGIQAPRDWVDRAVGANAHVAALWTGHRNFVALWDNEFFNQSIGPVYNFAGPPDGLPQETISTAAGGGLRDSRGPLRSRFVLVDDTLQLAGRVVARDKGIGMDLYEAANPLRVQGSIDGLYVDSWSGASLTYTRYACKGGSLTVSMLSDPNLHPTPQTVSATSAATGKQVAAITFRPGLKPVSVTVPLRSSAGRCQTGFTVTPTASPSEVTPGNPDTRQLGVRFLSFDYRPPASA